MERHAGNALALARALRRHAAVETVHYPGLADDPGHEVARRQMTAFGGMLSIRVKGGRERAVAAAARLRLFVNATSLGGTESLIEHRASSEGPATTTPQNLLRVSVGLEHPDDLIADLDQPWRGLRDTPTAGPVPAGRRLSRRGGFALRYARLEGSRPADSRDGAVHPIHGAALMQKPFVLSLILSLAGLACGMKSQTGAVDLKTDDQKTLYALGLVMSDNLATFNLSETDLDLVKAGLTDGVLKRARQVDLAVYGPSWARWPRRAPPPEPPPRRSPAPSSCRRRLSRRGGQDRGRIRLPGGRAGQGRGTRATDTVKVHYKARSPTARSSTPRSTAGSRRCFR